MKIHKKTMKRIRLNNCISGFHNKVCKIKNLRFDIKDRKELSWKFLLEISIY